jgi:hypothetical protein
MRRHADDASGTAEWDVSGTTPGEERAVAAPEEHDASSQANGADSDVDGYRHTQHEPVRAEVRGEVGPLIEGLHDLFERDRGVASQGSSARCGICYLHFPHADLIYREEEGFYVCPSCMKALGHAQLFMIRRQQK